MLARLSVLSADMALVVAVSLGVTAIYFTPAAWVPFIAVYVLLARALGAKTSG